MKRVELLAPAGDLEKLKIAVMYGADAVFIGGKIFSLRSRASNFTYEDIKEGCDFAHAHGSHIHVTCNILPHEGDIDGLIEHLLKLEECGVDAIICASIYILKMVKKYTHMEAHISTQETTTNTPAVRFWVREGADRVVLGRELSIPQIKEIKENANTDIEVFIHGGMCVSYSGRCMLSNNMTNRDANRGGCAHSCRWCYDLVKDGKKYNPDGDYFAMSSKDLCAIPFIPKLMDIGVDSFKIEGRMKSINYIATVVNAYRHLIDEYEQTGKVKDMNLYINQIKKGENRLTSIGFLNGDPTINEQLYDLNLTVPTKEFIGIVKDYDKENKMLIVEQRNYFEPNSIIEVFTPNETFNIHIDDIYDLDGNKLDAARHPLQMLKFKCEYELKPYDLLRLGE